MFWIICTIFILITLAFILPSLLSKNLIQDATREQNIVIAKEQLADLELRFKQGDINQEDYQSTKDELEMSLFNDLEKPDLESADSPQSGKNVSAWFALLIIPLTAIPVYMNLGNLDFAKHLDPKIVADEYARINNPVKADGSPDLEKIAENLKAEMESNPTDPKGWFMLGRAYMSLKNYKDAAESFDKSLSIRPDLSDTMVSLANALSLENKGKLIGRPRTLVNKALTIDSGNVTALWLSGMAASQEGEYLESIEQWEKVLPFLETKPSQMKSVTALIAESKRRLKPTEKSELAAAQNKVKENDVDTDNKEVKVTISLSDNFKDKASPDDFVFIYAKAMSGPPMPLAAVKKQVKDLPVEIVLNDEMAMMPSLKLSSFKNVSVGARISKTGEPIAKNGDLFNEKEGVTLGDTISLEIDKTFKK